MHVTFPKIGLAQLQSDVILKRNGCGRAKSCSL